MHPLLLLVFFVSGAAGLIGQVVWVRQVSLAFGSTLQSASLVTAVVLGGLGLGGWFAGRWADKRSSRASLRAYALAEVLLAVFGVAIALALPLLATEASLTWTVPDARGWQVLAPGAVLLRGVMVVALLGPSALVMGSTLTLLVRAVVPASLAGVRVGWLYGVNTLGAAAGALFTDAWLVPQLGLLRTLFAAAALNLLAGVVAMALPARGETRPTEGHVAEGHLVPTAAALALAGFAAMGAEMLWLRFLSAALGPYRAVFSGLLAVMLLGLCLGALLAGELTRRWPHPARWFALAQAGFAISLVGGLLAYDPEALVRAQLAAADSEPLHRALLVANLGRIAAVLFVPSVCLGASFPLGNALAQRQGEVGARAGVLYLATTSGNVLGALSTGFVWLPLLGMQATTALLAALAALAPLCLGRRGAFGSVGLAAAGVVLLQPPHILFWKTFPANRVDPDEVLAIHEGRDTVLAITGRPEGPARLWTGGHPMTSTTHHAQRYMRLMAHLPLLLQDEPERVAVICFGVGNTLSAAGLHPSVRELHAIDLSGDVLAHGDLFAHANHGILEDPRLTVFVDDGRHHLRRPGPAYDLITLEPPPMAHAGIAALYSVEFYEAARARLRPGGAISQWLPAYQVPEDEVRALVAAFATVFPEGVVLTGSGREMLLVAGPAFSLDAVSRRLDARPAVAADLDAFELPDATALAATFLGPATATAPPLTDDHPSLEYSQVSHVMETRLPSDLFAPTAIDTWCGDCDDPALHDLLALSAEVVTTEPFLAYSNLRRPTTTHQVPWAGEGDVVDLLWRHPSFGAWLYAPASLTERALWLHDRGRLAEARAALDLAARQAPFDPLIADLAASWP
ncbi:MAG: hypothetical protein EP330_05895 [Deltaproteobacteria bacterium]|nr:MAG: hypothetical protein EP330_05895 [Deltaproteobacteria bacterium]